MNDTWKEMAVCAYVGEGAGGCIAAAPSQRPACPLWPMRAHAPPVDPFIRKRVFVPQDEVMLGWTV